MIKRYLTDIGVGEIAVLVMTICLGLYVQLKYDSALFTMQLCLLEFGLVSVMGIGLVFVMCIFDRIDRNRNRKLE